MMSASTLYDMLVFDVVELRMRRGITVDLMECLFGGLVLG